MGQQGGQMDNVQIKQKTTMVTGPLMPTGGNKEEERESCYTFCHRVMLSPPADKIR